jgi:hypothetical protein
MKSHIMTEIQKKYPAVAKMVDGTKHVTIEVTNTDCNSAKRSDYQKCALANACNRALNPDGVVATRSTIYIIFGKKAVRYILPATLSREITSFDRGGFFAPGLYQLKKPWAGNKLKNDYPPQKTQDVGVRGKKASLRHVTTGIRAIL